MSCRFLVPPHVLCVRSLLARGQEPPADWKVRVSRPIVSTGGQKGRLASHMPASGVQVADVLAAATLFLLVAAPIALAAFLVARSRMNPLQCVLWVIGYCLCKLLWVTRW